MPLQRSNQISDYHRVEFPGKVRMRNKTFADVNVMAYFKMFRWYFIIHSDCDTPEYLAVSEASSGCNLGYDTYYEVEDALYFAIPIIEKQHYRFATLVSNILVENQYNLTKINLGGISPAIYSTLWLQ